MECESERVAQIEFEFDRLLRNRVEGECGFSPTLVFVPVFVMIKRTRKKIFLTIKLYSIIRSRRIDRKSVV